MAYVDFLTVIHKATKRDYVARVTEYSKAEAAKAAKKWDFDYWDGSRHTGYGGYKYDGRWRKVADAMVAHYGLKPGDKVLDVGCGKAFLLYDLMQAVPGLEVAGIDVSKYGLEHAMPDVKPFLQYANATKLPFPDKSFDFVLSINAFHNLFNYELYDALKEVERVGRKNKYICVESWRNEEEKANLLYWQLTCETFGTPAEWEWWFKHTGYTGDHSFIYFEQVHEMKGLAAILVELKKPLVLEEIEIPPLRFGQVLVRVQCSGICGAQIGEINGVKGPDKFLPHLLGHEGTATVLETGEGVRRVKAGDKVVMHWRKAAGIDAPTPAYQSKIGKINSGWVTTFNELAIVSENRVTPIPADFDPEVAALFGCAVTTAFGVINNNAQLKIGQSILVFGAGGVGLNIVQGAAMVGANPIIAVDMYDNRLELAKRLGATHVINSKTSDAESEIRKIIGHDGVDVAVDNTGNTKIIELLYRLTGASGRTILVGVPPKDSTASIYTLPLHFEKSLFGSHGGECQPDVDIPRYVRLCQAGKLKLDDLIGKRYALPEINQAIADMGSGALAGRAIINMPVHS